MVGGAPRKKRCRVGAGAQRGPPTPASHHEVKGDRVVEEEAEEEEAVWALVEGVQEGQGVDLTPQFDHIFTHRRFHSFTEFEELFERFKDETGSVFRVMSSSTVAYENYRRKKQLVPERFRFVAIKYCCVHYGRPKTTGQGIRVKQRYLGCGCESMLQLTYTRGLLTVAHVNMRHNHGVSSSLAPYYAINRRLSSPQLQSVAGLVDLMPTSRSLQQFLQGHFRKPVTLQDAKNIRARIKGLQVRQAADSSAVRSIESDTGGEKEEEESTGGNVEVEELVDFPGCYTEVMQEEVREEEEEMTVPVKTQEEELQDTQARLSALLTQCSTEDFWHRLKVLNRVLQCWEGGQRCEVQCGGVQTLTPDSSDAGPVDDDPSAKLSRATADPRPSRSDPCGFVSPVGNYTSLDLLPSSSSNRDVVISIHEYNRNDGEVGKHLQGAEGHSDTQKHISMQDSKPVSVFPSVIQTDLNVTRETAGEVRSKAGKDRAGGQEETAMCAQAVEVEIEIDRGEANVRLVKTEPLEYQEVDVVSCCPPGLNQLPGDNAADATLGKLKGL